MSDPRNHHFIPVFYLKKWITNRLLWEYKKVRGKVVSRNVGPKGTGFERDLYAFDEFPPHRAQFLEAVFLKRTDDYASKALDQLVSGEFPRTVGMRSAWSRFVYQLLVRHPDPFAEIRRAAREDWLVGDVATQIEYERRRTSDMPATFEEFIISEPGLRDDMIVSLLQSAFDNDRVGVRINTLIWHVLDLSAAAYPLLTSDWPMENALGAQNPFVALPIGPRQLFIGTHDETTIRNLRPTRSSRL